MDKENEEDLELEPTNEGENWEARAKQIEERFRSSKERQKSAKAEYENRISILEKELESFKKPNIENQSDEFGLTELTYLLTQEIKNEDEIKLVKDELKIAGLKKEQLPLLVGNPYFKTKLEALKTAQANQIATSDIKGEAGSSSAKNTPEYWVAKGELPPRTPENRKLRSQIAQLLQAKEKTGSKFYSD